MIIFVLKSNSIKKEIKKGFVVSILWSLFLIYRVLNPLKFFIHQNCILFENINPFLNPWNIFIKAKNQK